MSYAPDCADCPTPDECKAADDCKVLRQIRHGNRATPSAEQRCSECGEETRWKSGPCGKDRCPLNTPPSATGAWLACSERLPEAGYDVLACSTEGFISITDGSHLAALQEDAKLNGELCYYTHWMPLPAGPKETAKVSAASTKATRK